MIALKPLYRLVPSCIARPWVDARTRENLELGTFADRQIEKSASWRHESHSHRKKASNS